MQMIELAQKDISVYICHFHLHLLSANISIKFPCHYFFEWKSLNGKLLSTSKRRPSSTSTSVEFNQVLDLTTQMLFDNKDKTFYKKQTLLAINLVSKSRPDQVKLVGRINIDLALIANTNLSIYSEFAHYKLTYCSVNADTTLKAQMSGKELTNKHPSNLDKSSFNDFFVINTANTSSPQFGTRPSPKFSASSGQNTFVTSKLKESRSGNLEIKRIYDKEEHERQQRERQEKMLSQQETHTLMKNFSTSQISKKDDTSFRTIPQRREPNFKSLVNDSLQNQSWGQKDNVQNNFSEEIDLNKKKIADLERKIGDLCKNLEESKTVAQRREIDNKEKEELIQKLAENEERMREQFESLRRMKISLSSNQNLPQMESDECQIPRSPRQQIKRSGLNQMYTQKISQALETQRILQQNQYIIRQLQATRSQLQRKLSSQRGETQQLQSIWKEKREHFEQKIRGLEKEKREAQGEIQQLSKYKYRVEEAIEEKNKMKLEYKEVEHELMKVRFQLNQKIHKNAQNLQKLQLKDTQIQKARSQIKDLSLNKSNFQKQFTDLLISNQKLHSLSHVKQQQLAKLQAKLHQSDTVISQLRGELTQMKKGDEEKHQLEQKLLQYNTHMDALQLTINKLQTQLQGSQHLAKANDSLTHELARLQQRLSAKDQQLTHAKHMIESKEGEIIDLTNQLQKMSEQKQALLQKNTSFTEQLQHIETLLQESFHKTSKESQSQIQQLKNQLLKSNEDYEQVLKHKTQLQEQIDVILEEKQQRIAELQNSITTMQQQIHSLSQYLSDKQDIINLKDIELQNRRSVTEQLTLKLQAMESKQNDMQQTIAVLESSAKQIFCIVQEKQLMDEELLQMRENTQHHLEIIKELQDIILQAKLEKEDLMRKYCEQIQKRDEPNNLSRQNSLIKKNLEQADLELQEMAAKLYQFTDELSAKQRCIASLQAKNDSLLKRVIYLESIQESEPHHYAEQNDQNPQLDQSLNLKQRQMELRLHQQKNMQKFVNQISELSQKIIELQTIINDKNAGKLLVYEGAQTQRLSREEHSKLLKNTLSHKKDSISQKRDSLQEVQQNDKSQEITPIKNRLNDELALQSADNNYILSDRKKPISNRSNESYASYEYVNPSKQSPERVTFSYDKQPHSQPHKESQVKQSQGSLIRFTEHNHITDKMQSQEKSQKKESPQLKISEMNTLIEVKNHIIKDLQSKCIELTVTIRKKDKQLAQKQQGNFTGRIRQNSSRKNLSNSNNNLPGQGNNVPNNYPVQKQSNNTHHITHNISQIPTKQQKSLKKRSRSRSRSASPRSKIAKNESMSEKEFIRMKNTVETQAVQLKRLKKNLRLMNLELSTLRHLKRQEILGQTQIRINKSFSHHNHNNSQIIGSKDSPINQANVNDQSASNLMMDTNYFNVSNAVYPSEKSYIIKKTASNDESISEMRRSPKKPSAYGLMMEKREKLQKKFNVTSRLGLGERVLQEKQDKENFESSIQQRIMSKLQNTAHFTNLNNFQDQNQFITTIGELRQKVGELQETLNILEEEKVFLENQLEMFEEEKFCLSSDLNAREIEIYELYKSIIGLREQLTELKFQNQTYLKMIQDHEVNVNSIVRKASETYNNRNNFTETQNHKNQQREKQRQYQRDPSRQPSKMISISVSGIDFLNQQIQPHSMQEIGYESIMRQQRQQQRYSLLDKIEKYQKRIEESLLTEKEKEILQEEIQSKQEIMIDQNQKLYIQENIIRDLNTKVDYLQSELAKLQQLMNSTDHYNNMSNSQMQGNTVNVQANSSNMRHQGNSSNMRHQGNSSNMHHYEMRVNANKDSVLEDRAEERNFSMMEHEKEWLMKENVNLKEETVYLGNEIDRINNEFAKLNALLYKRQDEITQLKLDAAQARTKHQNQIQGYQQTIYGYQQNLNCYEQTIHCHQQTIHSLQAELNSISQQQQPIPSIPSPINPFINEPQPQSQVPPEYWNLLSYLESRIHDLGQEFQNLKLNITNILNHNQLQNLNQSNKEFLLILLNSMENTIASAFHVLTQANSENIQQHHSEHIQQHPNKESPFIEDPYGTQNHSQSHIF